MFYAYNRKEGKEYEEGRDVSSHGEMPYKLFSPFTYSSDIEIPVPGQEGLFANSVESIWQGLKVIDGQTDFELFSRKPRKRRGIVEGHLLGNKLLDLIDARKKIYVPSYMYYIEHFVPKEVKEQVLEDALSRRGIAFYDVSDNHDIEDASAPFAHSTLTMQYFCDYLDKREKELKQKIDKASEKKLVHETIAEPVSRGLNLFRGESKTNQRLIAMVLDGYQRYYAELLRKIEKL